jgi:glycosyltransferase involved in cell wall biosynthesis
MKLAIERDHVSPLHEDGSSIHVVILTYFYEADLRTPQSLLDRYSTIRPFAQALHKQGAIVTVMQRFKSNLDFSEDGVNYHFRADLCSPPLRKWEIPYSLHSSVNTVCTMAGKQASTVIHVNGLLYPLQLRTLRTSLPPDCAIAAQHHADKPWRRPVRGLQRWGLRAADGFFFAAYDLALPWVKDGLISREQPIFQVMEGSTYFRPEDRTSARARTGLSGTPTVLWVGRLISLKDPLTVLEGFEHILQDAPGAKLYMVYGGNDLLGPVRNRIAASGKLAQAVILLGKLDHPQLEDIYNSSDYFVLGSHDEGSGFALAEAMACGVVPVVTDIASFRAMTDSGSIGATWTPGKADSFSNAFLRTMRQPLELLSESAVRTFQSNLSYPAIARQAMCAYKAMITARQGVPR